MKFITNLKIKYRIVLGPILAIITFIMILTINHIFSFRNKNLLKQIEFGYVSALELSRDMEETLYLIQSTLQSSVATADMEEIARADSLYNSFLGLIEETELIEIVHKKNITELKKSFIEYYPVAVAVTKQMT